MHFEECLELSRNIAKQFDELENKEWTIEAIVIELSKQIGDLNRRILNKEGYYLDDRKERTEYLAVKEAIGNELADIFHQVIRIADYYNIDLLDAHIKAREGEQKYIDRIKKKNQLDTTNNFKESINHNHP